MPNEKWESPLMYAVEHGHTGTVILLLHNSARLEIDLTPGSLDITEYLKEYDVKNIIKDHIPSNISFETNSILETGDFSYSSAERVYWKSFFLVDKDKNTALMVACMKGYTEIVDLLLKRSNKYYNNLKNSKGKTALMIAAEEGHVDIVKLLLKNDVNKKLKDTNDKTALDLASNAGHEKVKELLDTNTSPAKGGKRRSTRKQKRGLRNKSNRKKVF
jgi:ankyrin repeat protein